MPANERLLLGSILLLGGMPHGLGRYVSPADFCDPKNQAVFLAMTAILARGEALEVATLEAELERMGKLALIGGLAELCEIVRNGGTHTIEHYARVVRDAARRHELARACGRLQEATELEEDGSVLAREMVALQGAYNRWDDTRR